MRRRAACMASASRSPTRCRNAWKSRSRASRQLYRMAFERGKPKGKLEKAGRAPNRRGTKVRFRPDPQIFGAKAAFKPSACSRWRARRPICSAASKSAGTATRRCSKASRTCPTKATFHFADGLKDYLAAQSRRRDAGASGYLHRHARQDRQPRRGRMGGRLDRRHRRLLSIPTATPSRRRMAARTNPACARRCCAA